jgi:Ca2+:H+ antiporter
LIRGSHGSTAAVGDTYQSKAIIKSLKASERRARLTVVLENPRHDPSERTMLISSTIPEAMEKIPLGIALRAIIFEKFVSIFFLLMPVAYWAHHEEWDAQWIFWLNFLVMIPLAAILGDFTEEAALHTNDTIGGLLNATFGNAVEVVVAIQALLANEIRVVQGSMLGSIFSNLLLVLGCCFFFGGLKYDEQHFNPTNASANIGLLALSSIALVLPTPFASYYDIHNDGVLAISRYSALFLLFMYIQLLIFQLCTHAHIFEGGGSEEEEEEDDEEEEEEEASIPFWVAMVGLLITTLTVTIFSDFLVDSIDDFCEASNMSKTFVGLILLPIVGNAVEHITAVTVAVKDKMDLSMGVAVGSCTQISLFVVPVTVLIGWALDRDMTLNFPQFEIILYVLSIFTVSICTLDGKSNWLLGSLLITTYFLIAIAFWFEDGKYNCIRWNYHFRLLMLGFVWSIAVVDF